MLESIFQVMAETPVLMVVFVVDLILIFTIVFYVAKKIYQKKRPDMGFMTWFTRFTLKSLKAPTHTIEGLYDLVVSTYTRRGVVTREMGKGFRAREKILEHTKEKEEAQQVLRTIFETYEGKMYGGVKTYEQGKIEELFHQFKAI
ncbi:MAG TPA: hypothetical protein ENN60_01775 [archaeon]|nr:hypothetical protein [archaeon]